MLEPIPPRFSRIPATPSSAPSDPRGATRLRAGVLLRLVFALLLPGASVLAQTIIVEPGETVSASGDEGTVIAIDAREGGIDVVNRGRVESTLDSDEGGEAIGIATGESGELVFNEGALDAEAVASQTTLLQEAAWVASAAVGIETGGGDDRVLSGGELDVCSDATAISVDISGAVLDDFLDVRTHAGSDAMTIDTGSGMDDVTLTHDASGSAIARAGAATVVLDFAGDASGDAKVDAQARAVGVGGGAGDDQVTLGGSLQTDAEASAGAGSVELTARDSAAAGAGATARSEAVGVDLGVGDDRLTSTSAPETTATATVTGVGASLFLDADAEVDAASEAIATSTGIEAGEGNDTPHHAEWPARGCRCRGDRSLAGDWGGPGAPR